MGKVGFQCLKSHKSLVCNGLKTRQRFSFEQINDAKNAPPPNRSGCHRVEAGAARTCTSEAGFAGGEVVQVESSTAGAENYLDDLRQENRSKDPSAEGRTARTGTTGAIAEGTCPWQ